MKLLLRSLLISALFGLCAAPSAQIADTTDAWRYLPLHEGNVWEYEHWIEECIAFEICTTERVGYERWTVTADSAVDGLTYEQLKVDTFSANGTQGGSSAQLVRFDTLAAAGYRRLKSGGEVYWPGHIACAMDAPFESEVACSGGWDGIFVSEFEEVTVAVNGSQEVRPSKYFATLIPWSEYVADVGLRSDGAVEFGGSWRELVYARNGDIVYGTEQFPVATEGMPESAALALAVYPNPAFHLATLAFSLDQPQHATLAVYDVLGRQVLSSDLGVLPSGEATYRLDVAVLPVGFYVVRLNGDVGAAATARLVVQ